MECWGNRASESPLISCRHKCKENGVINKSVEVPIGVDK